MQSTFEASRIFHDQDGWYVVMRASDQMYLDNRMHKCIADQHLMGPFADKYLVEQWLDGFLSMHSVNRQNEEFIADNIVNTLH